MYAIVNVEYCFSISISISVFFFIWFIFLSFSKFLSLTLSLSRSFLLSRSLLSLLLCRSRSDLVFLSLFVLFFIYHFQSVLFHVTVFFRFLSFNQLDCFLFLFILPFLCALSFSLCPTQTQTHKHPIKHLLYRSCL